MLLRRQARRAADKQGQAEMLSGGGSPEWTVRVCADKYLDQRRKRGELAPASLRDYRARLDLFVASVGADRAPDALQRRHIGRWLDSLGRLTPASRRAYFVTARLLARWMRDEGHVTRDLFAGMEAPREPQQSPRNLSRDDVARVLEHCDARGRLIAVLMLQLGLRAGEVARLTVADIDLSAGVLLVHGKGAHERVVPLSAQATEVLRDWMREHRIIHGPVVRSLTQPDRGVTAGTIGNVLVKAMYEAGVKSHAWDRVSGHSLRHTAAADMLRSGGHVRDVQQVLGHKNLKTTERYMPLLVGTLGEAVEGRRY